MMDRRVFSFKNVVALLISVCLSVYTWIIVMKVGYGRENALLGAIFAFGLTIEAARVWFGAFKFSGNKSMED